MSKISLKPNNAGSANFEIAAPATNVDRTFTLPDETGTIATVENIPPGYEDQDALDLFNVTGSAPVYACRAWVNFSGTGTVSIRESGNVSSITDIATGVYQVNFNNSMPDAAYCVNVSTDGVQNGTSLGLFGSGDFQNNISTSSFEFNVRGNSDGNLRDANYCCVSVFR